MQRRTFLLMAAATSALAQTSAASEFIFTSAPFASAHASNIVELRNSDLLASWFGGSAEGKPDVAIWSARRASGKWSEPVELVREPDIACYNPVAFYTRDNRLWLYYKFGQTWSPVEHLPAGLYGPSAPSRW